jgi:hypothetical protein
MFKIFCTYICCIIYKMQHLEVSGVVRHIYIYIYIYVVRQLKIDSVLYRAENICFCGGLQLQDLSAQKIPASGGLLAFKSQYFRG